MDKEHTDELVKSIVKFGYDYGIFKLEEDYQNLQEIIIKKLYNFDFVNDLYNVIIDKINDNNKVIRKNKELKKLLYKIDKLKLEFKTDNWEE